MPTPTYNLIQEITVSGSVTTSVTFSSIPQTYDDLVLVCKNKEALDEVLQLRFNSDSGTNYLDVTNGVTATTTYQATSSSQTRINVVTNTNRNQDGWAHIDILNYSNTTWHKVISIWAFGYNTTNLQGNYQFSKWASASAISSINLSTASGTNIVAGSVYHLYGIKGSN